MFLDLKMPVMDGFGVLDFLNEKRLLNKMPVYRARRWALIYFNLAMWAVVDETLSFGFFLFWTLPLFL